MLVVSVVRMVVSLVFFFVAPKTTMYENDTIEAIKKLIEREGLDIPFTRTDDAYLKDIANANHLPKIMVITSSVHLVIAIALVCLSAISQHTSRLPLWSFWICVVGHAFILIGEGYTYFMYAPISHRLTWRIRLHPENLFRASLPFLGYARIILLVALVVTMFVKQFPRTHTEIR